VQSNAQTFPESQDKKSFFGDWIHNVDALRTQFENAEPFENIIIPNFLNEQYADLLHQQFPHNFTDWHKYNNPIEVKYAYDDIINLPIDI
jgi:hypothetical protein